MRQPPGPGSRPYDSPHDVKGKAMGSGTEGDATHCDGSDVHQQLNALLKFAIMR